MCKIMKYQKCNNNELKFNRNSTEFVTTNPQKLEWNFCLKMICIFATKQLNLNKIYFVIVLLERVLLKLGCTETDEQLEAAVNKFLGPVLLKIDSPNENVRKRVSVWIFWEKNSFLTRIWFNCRSWRSSRILTRGWRVGQRSKFPWKLFWHCIKIQTPVFYW